MAWLKQGATICGGVRTAWVVMLVVCASIASFAIGYHVRQSCVARNILGGPVIFLGSFPTYGDAMQVVLDLSKLSIRCRIVKDGADDVPSYQVFVYCDSKEEAAEIKRRIVQRVGYGVVVAG